MTEILALLQNLAPLFEKTTLRQMGHVIFGMLVTSGRITMLGLSRWTEKGGSYRTIQRFYHSVLPWKMIHWLLFRMKLLKSEDEHIIAGDEVVASKAGKETYGLDRFFSGIQHVSFRDCHFLHSRECTRRTFLSNANHASCEKHRRKGRQQSQSRSKKGCEENDRKA